MPEPTVAPIPVRPVGSYCSGLLARIGENVVVRGIVGRWAAVVPTITVAVSLPCESSSIKSDEADASGRGDPSGCQPHTGIHDSSCSVLLQEVAGLRLRVRHEKRKGTRPARHQGLFLEPVS